MNVLLLWIWFVVLTALKVSGISVRSDFNLRRYSLRKQKLPATCPLISLSACTRLKSTCEGDAQCGIGLKCCYDGCIKRCILPNISPIRSRNNRRKKKNKRMSCFLSNTRKANSTLCPSGFTCEPRQKRRNKGVCVKRKRKVTNPHQPYVIAYDDLKVCFYKDSVYKHHDLFYNNECRICRCENTVINCHYIGSQCSKPLTDSNYLAARMKNETIEAK